MSSLDLFSRFVLFLDQPDEDGVLLLLFVLVLQQITIQVDFEVELDFVLNLDDPDMLVVVGSLDEQEQVLRLLGYPHVFAE